MVVDVSTGPHNRFDRQVRFAPLGTAGQARLEKASVFVLGAGALGGVLAQNLVRTGVGRVVIVDRDHVDWTNLPRQVLFEDRHAQAGTLKAHGAQETLERMGGPTRVEAIAAHVDADNLPELAADCDLLLDGSDNLETRYLLNDYAVRENKPWVYAGVIGGGGLVMPIRPGEGPCLRCVFPEPPPPGSLETCDTAGVLMPAVGMVASLAAGLGLRLLTHPEDLEPRLIECDVWHGEVRQLSLPRHPACPTCVQADYRYLDAPLTERTMSLCGRNTVQVRGHGQAPDLDVMARRLGELGPVQRMGPVVRAEVEGHRITLFPDGRALIEGTEDKGRALALYDRYLA